MGDITIRKVLGTFSSRLSEGFTFWAALAPAGAAGVVTAALASSVKFIADFGPFGWWTAGLLGFFIYSGAQALIGVAKDRRAIARTREIWALQADSFNPLDSEFTRKRIVLTDLASPIDRRIQNKRFTECELMGPANILLIGKSTLANNNIINCDICVIRDDSVLSNIVVFEDCEIFSGKIFGCTIFMTDKMYADHFINFGVPSISYRKK